MAIDNIPFAVPDQTELDGDDGASSTADLQGGPIVEVEGTLLDDGSLEAREVDVEDDSEVEHSITAPTESIGDGSVSMLGVTIEAPSDTALDHEGGLSALGPGSRVEVEYEFREGARVATEIERKDDD